jgi:hypothetical protein
MTQRTVTKQVEVRDSANRVIGMQNQQVDNPNFNPILARAVQEQTSRRPDPNDPNNYGQAA